MKPVTDPFAGERYPDAWQRLRHLRRRYLLGLLGFLLGLPILAMVIWIAGRHARILAPVVIVPLFALMAMHAVTHFQLLSFRCPSCGERFVATWMSHWPWRRRCPHCAVEVPRL